MAYQKGSGFVGLQQYLGANQRAAQQMGGQIVGDLEHSVKDAENEINAGVSTFNAQAAAGTPQYDQATADLEGNLLGNAARAGQIVYTGPHTLRDVVDTDQLRRRVEDVGKQAALAGTDAGRATLLQQRYGQNYASTGGRSLDAFLSGVGGGEGLANTGKALTGLKSYLGTAQSNAESTAGQGIANAAALSNKYKTDFPVSTAPYTIGPQATSAGGSTPKPGVIHGTGAHGSWSALDTASALTGTPLNLIFGRKKKP